MHHLQRPQQTILPVLLRQVRDAVEEEKQKFVIDGKPVTQLTMVVQIVTADKSATHMQMLVDDGTAQVAMRQYHQAEDDSEAAPQLRAGMYVRVVGNIRKMKDGMNVIGFSVEPVTDFNEVTFHIARAMQVHALNTKGAPPAASAAAAAGGTATPAASASAIVAEASSSPIQTQVLDGTFRYGECVHSFLLFACFPFCFCSANEITITVTAPDTESGVSLPTVVVTIPFCFCPHSIPTIITFPFLSSRRMLQCSRTSPTRRVACQSPPSLLVSLRSTPTRYVLRVLLLL
jgi:hypothetical protein